MVESSSGVTATLAVKEASGAASPCTEVSSTTGVTGTSAVSTVAVWAASTDTGLDPEVPGEAIAFLCTHPHPMAFSGQEYIARDLCVAHGLIDVGTLAKNEGEAIWGLPRG